MSLRDTTDTTKMMAHRILDLVKAKQPVDPSRVDWALVILGDSNGTQQLTEYD